MCRKLRLPYSAKIDALSQPVNGYEYLLGQVINGLISNSNISPNYLSSNDKKQWIVNQAIDITTKLVEENNKRYENDSV